MPFSQFWPHRNSGTFLLGHVNEDISFFFVLHSLYKVRGKGVTILISLFANYGHICTRGSVVMMSCCVIRCGITSHVYVNKEGECELVEMLTTKYVTLTCILLVR